jgi:hypothetical protein
MLGQRYGARNLAALMEGFASIVASRKAGQRRIWPKAPCCVSCASMHNVKHRLLTIARRQ